MTLFPIPFVECLTPVVKEIIVRSPAFLNKGMIPNKYTADGTNVNPPLALRNIPDETQSMVLLV